MKQNFYNEFTGFMDSFVTAVYECTDRFPKTETYGITSQLRRASLSIVLNYIEGYARKTEKSMKQFARIAYGSLRETQYLLSFSYKRGYITEKKYTDIRGQADRIGAILWGVIKKLS